MNLFASQFTTVLVQMGDGLVSTTRGDYRLYLLSQLEPEARYVSAADNYLAQHSADRRFESYQKLCQEGGLEEFRHCSGARSLLSALSGDSDETEAVHSLIHQLNHAEHLLPFYESFLSFMDETHRAVWPEVEMIRSALDALDNRDVRGRFIEALKKRAGHDELRSVCQPVLETMDQVHTHMGNLLGKRRSYRGPNFAPERFVEIVALTQLMTEGSKHITQVADPMDHGNLIFYFGSLGPS